MALCRVLLALLGLFIVFETALAYNTNVCCERAKNKSSLAGLVPSPENQICGQEYSPTTPPAQSMFVTYTFCRDNCPGIQISKFMNAKAWAMPLVAFILPSVIFCMTIPRRNEIEFNYIFEFEWLKRATRYQWVNNNLQLLVSLLAFVVILIPVTVDTVLWVSVIIIGAGHMIVGGLYEAHLDYRIMKYVKDMNYGTDEDKLRIKRELLVTIVSGNLMMELGSPQKTIPTCITLPGPVAPTDGCEKARSRLLSLLSAEPAFGEQTGSPVLFYLGGFVYTILDLRTSLSDELAALALSFGLQWMIIVHVAIVSGCLQASNNPNTAAGIVGSGHIELEDGVRDFQRRTTFGGQMLPIEQSEWAWNRFFRVLLGLSPVFGTEFQPVSLWSRGINKMKWLKQSEAWREDPAFRKAMEITWLGWIFKILIPALSLSVLPPGSGGIVAYWTPPTGIGCRALNLLTYAVSQAVITIIATVRNAVEHDEKHPLLGRLFTGWCFQLLCGLFWFGAWLSAVGGTIMQLMGVYSNCICQTTFYYWWNDVNKTNPLLDMATDTEDARLKSRTWIVVGTIATAFMTLAAYGGWWFQRLIRHRFTNVVKDMYVPEKFLITPRNSGETKPAQQITAIR